ncbi:MAG: hypothetical protein R3B84_23865 [Zavarzinella sp.]
MIVSFFQLLMNVVPHFLPCSTWGTCRNDVRGNGNIIRAKSSTVCLVLCFILQTSYASSPHFVINLCCHFAMLTNSTPRGGQDF